MNLTASAHNPVNSSYHANHAGTTLDPPLRVLTSGDNKSVVCCKHDSGSCLYCSTPTTIYDDVGWQQKSVVRCKYDFVTSLSIILVMFRTGTGKIFLLGSTHKRQVRKYRWGARLRTCGGKALDLWAHLLPWGLGRAEKGGGWGGGEREGEEGGGGYPSLWPRIRGCWQSLKFLGSTKTMIKVAAVNTESTYVISWSRHKPHKPQVEILWGQNVRVLADRSNIWLTNRSNIWLVDRLMRQPVYQVSVWLTFAYLRAPYRILARSPDTPPRGFPPHLQQNEDKSRAEWREMW